MVALIDLGRRLQARAVALRKRAAFEHLIAKSSTSLINCPPGETKSRLEQALAELGTATGVNRAYVALAETPVRVYAWSVDGAPFPSGWPEAALTLPEQLEEARHGIIAVPNVASLPPGAAKTTLMTFGVQGWACASLLMPGRARGILGFDTFRPTWGVFFPLPVVRLAGDAIGNAIERELFERDRARLTARLERALRMQMVGQFASGIAHNFNNIIGAILGYSEMAAAEIGADTKAARHLAEIQRAAERGRDLVDSILTFGRRSDARTSVVSATALLEETASLLRATLPAGVELVVSNAPSDLAVFGKSRNCSRSFSTCARTQRRRRKDPVALASLRMHRTSISLARSARVSCPPAAMCVSSSATMVLVSTRRWPADFSSRFSRPVLAGRALASQPSARSFATMKAQSTL